MSDAGYETFDVEAGVGVRGWGATRAQAFAQVALGVLALTVRPDDVTAREAREVRAQGETPETLLVNFVNECLYVHEMEGFAVALAEVDFEGEGVGVVHARLHGEPIDPTRHQAGSSVKAATLHRASVSATRAGHEARLIVDV